MDNDITIIGAGPAGLSFALLLANSGLRIALIDKQSRDQLALPAFDGRDIALTHQSQRILQSLGVWARIEPADRSCIKTARVQDGTSSYSLEFDAADSGTDALGTIVSNHVIRQALFDQMQSLENVELHTDALVSDVRTNDGHATIVLGDGQSLRSRLVVSADSRFSETRRMMGIAASMHDFGRVCIVCRVQHEQPHDQVAFECFHYGRTLAVLPLSENTSSIVITAAMHQRAEIMNMDEGLFNHDLQHRFSNRLGCMSLISPRFAYPLVGVHARRFHATRFALIGDAAVGMHPVTAHGYNLGLRGAEILALEIMAAKARAADIAGTAVLRRYQAKHMRKTIPIYRGTNEIVRLFTDDRLPVKLARKAVLRLSNNLPPIKRVIRHLLTQPGNRTRLLPLRF
ncbi:MAG TPA: 5-demethoxyubiquinol-8 5-hydroxylase UbiM [Woeseiaceae bacterium]|nr:5-demethoxyubiquinol-8 5-hydroxylase UbiM [Woeseiaceae bacterium]